MTFRLILGIDPGLSGAIAALADGDPADIRDMPTCPRITGKGKMVDATALRDYLRDLQRRYVGAYTMVVLEKVGGHRGQGGSASFNFGQGDGIVRGVLACLDLPVVEVYPQTWKKYLRLTGQTKDAARHQVIARYPDRALKFLRAKDDGRADALLLALWAELTETVPDTRAA